MNVMVLVLLDKLEGISSVDISKKTYTGDFETKYSFQIPYQNSHASLVCLLQVLFLFLEYRRFLDTVSNITNRNIVCIVLKRMLDKEVLFPSEARFLYPIQYALCSAITNKLKRLSLVNMSK